MGKRGWAVVAILILSLMMLGFCVLCGFIISGFDRGDSSANQNIVRAGGRYKAALVYLNGPITETDPATLFSSSGSLITPSNSIENINAALEDDEVKAIILKIESPGGEVAASDLIYKHLMYARTIKPIVVYTNTTLASGGYYIASGANSIVAHPNAIVGSIGVIIQTSNWDGLYEKLGVETRTFKSADLKDDSTLYDANPNGELEKVYQGLVDEAYESFLVAISDGRGVNKEELRVLADGRVYSGKKSFELGLVDRNGYIEEALEEAESLSGESDLSLVEYNNASFLDSILGSRSLFGNVNPLPSAPLGMQLLYMFEP